MKKNVLKRWLLLMLILPLAAASAATKLGYEQPNQKPILLTAQHPQFKVALSANPTTGYRWFLKTYDHALFQLTDYQYQQGSNKEQVGAPGTAVFYFTATKVAFKAPQLSKLHFAYLRPWKGCPAKEKNVSILTQSER